MSAEAGVSRPPLDDPALEEVRVAYESRDLILFVGAGTSAAAGLPSWERLIRLLAKQAGVLGADGAALQELEELISRHKYIDALTLVKQLLGESEFRAVVERVLDARSVVVPEAVKAIAALAPRLRLLVTTNLDHLLLRALGGEWSELASIPLDVGRRRGVILKLHGTLNDSSTWVLTRDEYRRFMYENERAVAAFRALMLAFPLFFVGYGLQDDDFDMHLEWVRRLAGGQPPRQFALVPKEEVTPAKRKRMQESGVRLISYENPDGKHSHLLSILLWLKEAGTPELEPSALIVRRRGVALGERGDLEGARAAFQTAIASGHPEWSPMAAFELGVLLQMHEMYNDACDAYLQAISTKHGEWAPKSANNLGLLRIQLGDMDGARAAFEQALASGNSEQALMARLGLGILLSQQGELKKAREYFQMVSNSGHAKWASIATEYLKQLTESQKRVRTEKMNRLFHRFSKQLLWAAAVAARNAH